ncbi:MAG: nitronate monooxygenase [Candidatus Cloacimonetes bacterium]|nr:nitronate monooxygenase [Candidatus Cloacimonadota bacterium]
MIHEVPKLVIGDLEIEIPIIQGGMGVGVSLSGLASAVANQGGIGVIAAAGIGMLEPDFNTDFKAANRRALAKEIKNAKRLTKGAIGVNLMLAMSDFDELLLVALDEGADVVLLGAGLILKIPDTIPIERLRASSTKFIPIVSSPRAAKIIFEYWAKNYNHVPDAVVVEGPLAGGHLGFKKQQINDPEYALEKLITKIIPLIDVFEKKFHKKIPVIAAGGIYTGADIYKFMQLGAQGVQMGTRFVATHECDTSIKFKEAYINCCQEDIIIIDSPVGLPGRAIHNKFLDDVSAGIKKPINCPWRCLKTCDYKVVPYCIAEALTKAKRGNFEEGFGFCGANAYRVEEILSVKEIIEKLLTEYDLAVSS